MSIPLERLRQELSAQGLDGFVVPRADEYQGEYVPPSAMRLAWLTGFSGSAGVAVVLSDRAALFVDGRYTLQAKAEVDEAAFALLHLVEQPPQAWLETALSAGQRLGYDPWLHTPNGVEQLRKACDKAGAQLVPCVRNPLDAVWSDRPAPPQAPVVAHPLEFAGRTAAEKRADIAALLRAEKQDAVVLTAPDSIAWLLNIRGGDVDFSPLPLGFAILRADASVELFLDPAKQPPAMEGVTLSPPSALGDALAALAGKSVRIDPSSAAAWIFDRLDQPIKAADPCALPKARKNDIELQGARRAHLRDGVALSRFLAWLDHAEAVTEISARDKLESFRSQGDLYCGPSFPTIAGAGPNGAIVHYRSTEASNRRLEPGQLFLLDSGGQYRDGTTDVTRTIAIGPAGAEERHRFTLVLKGHIALASARFPEGTTGSQLDVLARSALWAEGLDYDHGTGHGVGSFLSVHEGPQRISKIGNAQALMPGMVLSNEPGYYKTGAYGIRIENLLAVIPSEIVGERAMLEFETLTLAPIDRRLIDPTLLSPAEITWLDGYHARVRAALSPHLDGPDQDWLSQATAPL